MTLDQPSTIHPYVRYVLCFLASLVPSAPVGLYKAAEASGAFIRSESVSVYGLWLGVVLGMLIAGPLFWILMKIGSPDWSPGLIRVAIVATASGICLVLLGQAAAATTWLNEYVAGTIWLLGMLTVGYLPFVKGKHP